jgi:hypothetical protein
VWGLCEALFVPLLPWLPLRLHLYVDEAIRPLAQSSKRAARPRDYVAVVGDSYAQGLGDWLHDADPDRNGPFASFHVLHELTRRDVVSWGRGGTGALGGFAAQPRLQLEALAASRRTALAPPDLLIAYFYEGNDLEDTLAELTTLTLRATPALSDYGGPLGTLRWIVEHRSDPFALALGSASLRDADGLRSAIETRLLPLYPLHGAAARGPWPQPYFARFVAALVRGRVPPQLLEQPKPGRNRVVIAGAPREIAGSLQAPAMELTPAETELALQAAEAALAALARAFPSSAVCLLYVPSPAALYEFADEPVSVQGLRVQEARFPSAAIRARSAELGARLRALAARAGDRFVDATPPLREAARAELLHGPRDWMHLNQPGQRALGASAAACLATPSSGA